MLAAEGDALVGLWMEGQKYFAGSLKGVPGTERFSGVGSGQGMA